jgi:hypothetical protein
MEDNPPGCGKIKVKYTCKMPGNCFSFTVLVRCNPDIFRFLCSLPQFTYDFGLVFRDFIFRREILFNIYSKVFLHKVPYVAEAGNNPELFSKEFFYSFSFGRRLNDY